MGSPSAHMAHEADASSDVDIAGLEGQPVVAIDVVGAPHTEALLRDAIALRPGAPFTRSAVRADLRRLWRVGLFDDAGARVVAESRGVRVELVVRERARIASVQVAAPHDPVAAPQLRRLRGLAGTIDDPERTRRTAARLEEDLRTLGHWRAKVRAERRPVGPDEVALCVAVEPGRRYVLDTIVFAGARELPPRQLAKLVQQDEGRINAAGGAYRADLLDLDLTRVTAAYYDAGFVRVRVGTPIAVVDDRRGKIRVTVPITEGPRYKVSAITWKGVPAALQPRYRSLLGVAPGAVFSRKRLVDGMDRIRAAERSRGKSGDVTPSTSIDFARSTIAVELEVGP